MHKLVLLGLFAAIQLGAADPRIGSWTLISAQSSLDPANRLSITRLHDEVHVVISGDTHLDFTAKLNGHEASVPGKAAFNQIELRKIDKHQVEVKEMKDELSRHDSRQNIGEWERVNQHDYTESSCRPDHRLDAKRGKEAGR